MQATDEWFANQDQLQQAMKKHPPEQLGHSGSKASTGMAEKKTSFEPKNVPLSSSASKQATKKVSWATGFLNKQKTAQPTKKQVSPPSNSNRQSRTLPIKVPQTCDMTIATKQVHPMTKSNPTSLPTMKVNVHDKKKPSTHCWFSQ